MMVKDVRIWSLRELFRVVLPAQNTRRSGVASFSEHYRSSNAATPPLHQGGASLCWTSSTILNTALLRPAAYFGAVNDPQESTH